MKDGIRKAVLSARNALSVEERRMKSSAIAERFLELEAFRSARAIMAYASFGSEVETKEIIDACFVAGKEVALPIVDRRGLLVGRIWESTELSPNAFGIPEPPREKSNLLDAKTIDLIIVPGVAFDRLGRRIGYGGGYYDRFLGSVRPDAAKIALAFEIQIVDRVPVGERDSPVDVIVTESEVIDCARLSRVSAPRDRGSGED